MESKAPEISSSFALVHFLIGPESVPHTLEMPDAWTEADARAHLAELLGLVGADQVELCDELPSARVQGEEYQVRVEATPNSSAGASASLLPDKLDVIVDFEDDDEPRRTVSVSIVRENLTASKPFLGGFRNQHTGDVFHHASTMASSAEQEEKQQPDASTDLDPSRSSRDAQTSAAATASTSAQTAQHSATQSPRNGLYLGQGRTLVADQARYVTSEQDLERRTLASVAIQTFLRAVAARWLARRARSQRQARREAQQALREKRSKAAAAARARETQRRTHPRTAADFEVLYNELDNWRQHETALVKADETLSEGARRAALEQVLAKETKLLQMVDGMKRTACAEARQRKTDRLLALMTSPKQWELADGSLAAVHTPETLRAKELCTLYKALQGRGADVDERLDTLLKVKWAVKDHKSALARDVMDLLDREGDLLNRGRRGSRLEGLRRRVENLFLDLIGSPDFNPEAGHIRKTSQEYFDAQKVVLRPGKLKTSMGVTTVPLPDFANEGIRSPSHRRHK